ncbi:MAG: sigma-54-dependent Fis family transcriptional regulator [bacterium]|nr:sigma-54-dependent Fis family transcriptional regulator [bacterium]
MMRILLADDDAALRRVLEFKLKKNGFEVTTVADGEEALSQVKAHSYDLLLADIRMPRLTGIELLEKVRNFEPTLKVVLMTAYATVPQAVEAVKLGAFDYLTKPFDDEQLLLTIGKALKFKKLEDENSRLKAELNFRSGLNEIIGDSEPVHELKEIITQVAPTDATVLITGESGSGKELVARAIHALSPRASSQMVAVNCAALPRDLLESELFGHVKGAFTGAAKDKRGKFEIAGGGTLMLDEISELAIDLQAKLLRAIQERVISPVGSETSREIDVRILAATNLNLKKRVSDGKFREDLFYRLNVIPIHVPSLRKRSSDIPLLASHFLNRHAPRSDVRIDPELMTILTRHHWPGNVRELENLIERMVVLRHGDMLTKSDLPKDFSVEPEKTETPQTVTFHEAEKSLILSALEKSNGNRTKAAELLAIPRHVLLYRLKKYGIAPE